MRGETVGVQFGVFGGQLLADLGQHGAHSAGGEVPGPVGGDVQHHRRVAVRARDVAGIWIAVTASTASGSSVGRLRMTGSHGSVTVCGAFQCAAELDEIGNTGDPARRPVKPAREARRVPGFAEEIGSIDEEGRGSGEPPPVRVVLADDQCGVEVLVGQPDVVQRGAQKLRGTRLVGTLPHDE